MVNIRGTRIIYGNVKIKSNSVIFDYVFILFFRCLFSFNSFCFYHYFFFLFQVWRTLPHYNLIVANAKILTVYTGIPGIALYFCPSIRTYRIRIAALHRRKRMFYSLYTGPDYAEQKKKKKLIRISTQHLGDNNNNNSLKS